MGIRRLLPWITFLALVCSAGPGFTQNYTGPEKCGSCHEFAYKVWATGPHAKAHEALTAAQLKDPKCNTCHTLVEDSDSRWQGVQCERCHGAGKYYQAPYVMKDHELAVAVGMIQTQPSHCEQCHTEGAPSIAPFDFKSMWARIDHGKAAREEWERTHNTARK